MYDWMKVRNELIGEKVSYVYWLHPLLQVFDEARNVLLGDVNYFPEEGKVRSVD